MKMVVEKHKGTDVISLEWADPTNPDHPYHHRLYVDPARQFLPILFERTGKWTGPLRTKRGLDRSVYCIETATFKQVAAGLIPSRVAADMFNVGTDGSERPISKTSLALVEFVAEPEGVDPKVFTLEFPKDVHVDWVDGLKAPADTAPRK